MTSSGSRAPTASTWPSRHRPRRASADSAWRERLRRQGLVESDRHQLGHLIGTLIEEKAPPKQHPSFGVDGELELRDLVAEPVERERMRPTRSPLPAQEDRFPACDFPSSGRLEAKGTEKWRGVEQ